MSAHADTIMQLKNDVNSVGSDPENFRQQVDLAKNVAAFVPRCLPAYFNKTITKLQKVSESALLLVMGKDASQTVLSMDTLKNLNDLCTAHMILDPSIGAYSVAQSLVVKRLAQVGADKMKDDIVAAFIEYC